MSRSGSRADGRTAPSSRTASGRGRQPYDRGRTDAVHAFVSSLLIAELVKLKVDILAAPSNAQALAAKQATAEIPIVMIWGVDPVSAGLIASMARPGGNVTGVTMDITPELGKHLQLLKELKPRLSRVGLLWDL